MGQKVFKCHVDQLRYRYSEFSDVSTPNDFDIFPSPSELVCEWSYGGTRSIVTLHHPR